MSRRSGQASTPKASMRPNISAAADVLPRSGWDVPPVHGRELRANDLRGLVQLGVGDSLFTWERELKGPSYFEQLLRFRISHYDRYGFGVHGVWHDTELIGQCGLQVLSPDADQVEFVIFLGQRYIRKGLGSSLAHFLVKRCRSVGMTTLYGVARPENTGALAILSLFEARPVGGIVHFNQNAVVYRIDLTTLED